jgi:hypothetical protein
MKLFRMVRAAFRRIETRISERSPEFYISGRNIKCPGTGTIDAAGGSVGHDEVAFRVGVPGPEGKTAFHQVIDDNYRI